MILNFDKVKAALFGAERIENQDGVIKIFRFTKDEEAFYERRGIVRYYERSFATAGIRLSFVSDTKKLSFSYRISHVGARPYAYFDIYVGGGLFAHFGKESEHFKDGFAQVELPLGEKHIEVYFPWTYQTDIFNVSIDDGASFIPKSRKKTMISFGDSITQGYDAKYPSLSYASQISRLLDADAVNKGIGGERFCPELLIEKCGNPDYITVAYGINDCHNYTYEYVKERSRQFYKRISELYPDAKIFAISPVFSLGDTSELEFGKPATAVDEIIRENCVDLDNVTVIRGWEFTPALTGFYADLTLHPNDLGFSLYAMNLYKEICDSI